MILPSSFNDVAQWITHYGSTALFMLLALGIIGLPIPDETLLVFAGFLMAKGKTSLIATPMAAYLGSMIGITISYILGYCLGHHFLRKYGYLIRLSHEKLDKAHHWFERIGKWFLTIGYFIPGIRHFTGFSAGATELKFWEFCLFAFSGAFIWVTSFLSIGYFFYNTWHHFN